MMKRLLLIEDSSIIVIGIQYILEKNGMDNIELHTARTFGEMWKMLAKETFDIAIIGVHLNEIQLEKLPRIITKFSSTAIILFTDKMENLSVKQLYKKGICGILDKKEKASEIVIAVKQALGGDKYVCQSLLQQFLFGNNSYNSGFSTLTTREKEVAQLLVKGKKMRR